MTFRTFENTLEALETAMAENDTKLSDALDRILALETSASPPPLSAGYRSGGFASASASIGATWALDSQ